MVEQLFQEQSLSMVSMHYACQDFFVFYVWIYDYQQISTSYFLRISKLFNIFLSNRLFHNKGIKSQQKCMRLKVTVHCTVYKCHVFYLWVLSAEQYGSYILASNRSTVRARIDSLLAWCDQDSADEGFDEQSYSQLFCRGQLFVGTRKDDMELSSGTFHSIVFLFSDFLRGTLWTLFHVWVVVPALTGLMDSFPSCLSTSLCSCG